MSAIRPGIILHITYLKANRNEMSNYSFALVMRVERARIK